MTNTGGDLLNFVLLCGFIGHALIHNEVLARNAIDRDKDNVPWDPNYCNDTNLQQDAALSKTALGQFLGYECDQIFYHCRLTVVGWKTYRKSCRVGLVFDSSGTQNCNYNFNVAGCGNKQCDCTSEQYACCLSEECIDLSGRCDGKYDCSLEEDEQNCASCTIDEFPCTTSEQCVSLEKRCDGTKDCKDGTDEQFCQECGAGKFWCRKSLECVDKEYRCNGNRDCRFGEDELFCSNPVKKQYLCEDQKHSVTRDDVCNGIEDCPDGSDELYCSESPSLNNVVSQPKSIERENAITNTQKVRKSLAKDDGNSDDTSKNSTKTSKPVVLQSKNDTSKLPSNGSYSFVIPPVVAPAKNGTLSKPWWKNELFTSIVTNRPVSKIGDQTKKTKKPRNRSKTTPKIKIMSTATTTTINPDKESEYFYDD